jgi:hypothetical protein
MVVAAVCQKAECPNLIPCSNRPGITELASFHHPTSAEGRATEIYAPTLPSERRANSRRRIVRRFPLHAMQGNARKSKLCALQAAAAVSATPLLFPLRSRG